MREDNREALLGCLWAPWNIARAIGGVIVRIVVPLILHRRDDER